MYISLREALTIPLEKKSYIMLIISCFNLGQKKLEEFHGEAIRTRRLYVPDGASLKIYLEKTPILSFGEQSREEVTKLSFNTIPC